jgi:CubicO group peptidase (beta-lactamase class C family)
MTYDQKTISGITDLLRKTDLMFPPGEEQEYSNAGYILLGAIIEAVTGKSYAQNVRERIVRPLKLKETYLEIKP